MKKRLSLTIMTSFVILTLVGCTENKKELSEVTLHASYPTFDKLDGLANKADLIVDGKIISSTFEYVNILEQPLPTEDNNELLNPGGNITETKLPYTIYDVEVQKAYKGDLLQKSIIQVKQLGGQDGNQIFTLDDAQKMKKNTRYIMFLETYEHSPASLLNPIQGVYSIENDKVISNEKNSIKFELKNLENLEKVQLK